MVSDECIEAFVGDAFSELGVAVSAIEEKIFTARLSEEFRAELQCDELLCYTFDKETFQSSDDSALELVTPGSPVLSWLVEKVQALGRIGRASLPVAQGDAGAVSQAVLQKFTVRNGNANMGELASRPALYVAFDFRFTLSGLETRETIFEVVVSHDGRVMSTEVRKSFDLENLIDDSAGSLSDLQISDDLHKIAHRSLEKYCEKEKSEFLQRLDSKRRDEEQQLTGYFSKMITELEGMLASVYSPNERADIQHQLDLVKRQLVRRLSEVEERYSCSSSLELLSALLIEHSEYNGVLEFSKSGEPSAAIQHTVVFSALRVEPKAYSCPVSGNETYQLAFVEDGRLIDSAETEVCAESAELWPIRELVRCSVDEQYLKPVFVVECPVGAALVNRKSLLRCEECFQEVSPAVIHSGTCSACGSPTAVAQDDTRVRSLIARCEELAGWKKWQVAASRDIEVFFLSGMFSRGKLIVKKSDDAIIYFAKRNRFVGGWEEREIGDSHSRDDSSKQD